MTVRHEQNQNCYINYETFQLHALYNDPIVHLHSHILISYVWIE